MIRGTAFGLLLLALYVLLLFKAGGETAVFLVFAPHLAVLAGKQADPLGALMFALYAAFESLLVALLSLPLTALLAGRAMILPVALLLVVGNTLREVYRYLAIDHFRPRSMRFGLACGCAAYGLLAGLALFR